MRKMTRTRLTSLLTAAAIGTIAAGPAFADCATDANAIRGELEEKGKALQAAGKRQAEPQVLCNLFRAYTTAEAKWVKFLQDNKDWCQIPAEIADRAKADSRKTANTRDKICQVAANGGTPQGAGKPPPQGSISSALGITTGYSLGQGSGKGVFDTLNGNALQR